MENQKVNQETHVENPRNIKDKTYMRSIKQPLLMVLLMILFLFSGINFFAKVFLELSFLLNAIFLFVTPFATISYKTNTIKVGRNMFYTDKFKLSNVNGISNDGTKVLISVKNYKHIVRFNSYGVRGKDGLKFIKDITKIANVNNPQTEEITKRSFVFKNYKRKNLLAILMLLLVVISPVIIITIDASSRDYYHSHSDTELVLMNVFGIITLISPILLFISIWLLVVPFITIKNNIIYVKRFILVRKKILYNEIYKVETPFPEKVEVYSKQGSLINFVYLQYLNEIQKEDFISTLNQIAKENNALNTQV